MQIEIQKSSSTARIKLPLKFIEKLLLIGIVSGIVLPLSINLTVIQLFSWMIPGLFLIIFLIFNSASTGNWKLAIAELWSFSIVILIVLIVINTLLADNFPESLPEAIGYCFALLVGIYSKNYYHNNTNKRQIVNGIIVFALIQAFFSILQQLTGTQIGNIQDYFGEKKSEEFFSFENLSRIRGTLGHPNLVANSLVFALPFLFIFQTKNKWMWLVKRLSILLVFLSVIFTFSRASITVMLLISAISFGRYYLRNITFRLKTSVNIFKVTILILFITTLSWFTVKYLDLILIVLEFGMNRIAEVFDGNQSSSTSGSFRMTMNLEAIGYMNQTLIKGMGFTNSRYVWDFIETAIPSWWRHQPHNIFIVFGLETGIPGLLCGLIINFYPIILLIRYRQHWDFFGFGLFLTNTSIILFSQIYLTPLSGELAPIVLFFQGISIAYCYRLKSI